MKAQIAALVCCDQRARIRTARNARSGKAEDPQVGRRWQSGNFGSEPKRYGRIRILKV